ncbi:putative tetratricopeptide-like helical domain superfamily protein [Tanacetum coccineum]
MTMMVLRSNSAAQSITRLQLSIPLSPFSSSYHSQSYPKITNLNNALKVFDEMSHTRPLPSVVKFTQLCCCQLHRSNDGFAVIGYCFKQDIVTNTAIFSTLLNGLVLERHCKTHDYVAAVGLLKLMDENGCKPNVVAYTTIIDSKCKHKMIDDAFKLFKKMVLQKGMSPNVITYISLISGLCKVGRWEQASKLLKEMLDEKMSPNVQTFNILVDTFCKDGKIEEAEDAINLMLERGIVPNIVTYSSLLNGYCLQGEMSKARSLFDLIVSKGIMPNVVTYNTLSKGYCKELKIYEAMHMFQEITKQGLEPNVVTYNTMLQGLFFVTHCEDTHKFFAEMQAQGHAPNERTYAIMLKGLCDNNQMEDALSLDIRSHSEKFSVFGIRLNLETLAPGLWIDANVIDCWGAILNYKESFRDAE